MNQEAIKLAVDIICQRYKLTKDEYSNLVFELGIEFLEKTFDGYSAIRKQFSLAPEFWAWWKVQINLVNMIAVRDKISLEDYMQMQLKEELSIPKSIFKAVRDSQLIQEV